MNDPVRAVVAHRKLAHTGSGPARGALPAAPPSAARQRVRRATRRTGGTLSVGQHVRRLDGELALRTESDCMSSAFRNPSLQHWLNVQRMHPFASAVLPAFVDTLASIANERTTANVYEQSVSARR